jgi:hypothetical protein
MRGVECSASVTSPATGHGRESPCRLVQPSRLPTSGKYPGGQTELQLPCPLRRAGNELQFGLTPPKCYLMMQAGEQGRKRALRQDPMIPSTNSSPYLNPRMALEPRGRRQSAAAPRPAGTATSQPYGAAIAMVCWSRSVSTTGCRSSTSTNLGDRGSHERTGSSRTRE